MFFADTFNFVESIVVAVLGATIVAAAAITGAPIEVNVLGGLAFFIGLTGIFVNNPKNKED